MSDEIARKGHLLEIYKGLVEVSALINGITDPDELLPAILEVARRVIGVEAATIFLLNAKGELELASASGGSTNSAEVPRIVVPPGKGIAGWVFEHRQPLLIPDAYADPRFYREADRKTGFRTRSILCVPLIRNNTEIGVLQVLNPLGRPAFDDTDMEAFTAYANLAATAIGRMRDIARQREQERISQEFAFAKDIQASFLPQLLPQKNGVQFGARYRPARHVGGDFYDVLETGDDEFYAVIGDVSGKGMPAALLMAQALSMFRFVIKPGIDPAQALSRLNERLCGQTIRGMFITATIARVMPRERCVQLASAGHCPPIRLTPNAGPATFELPGCPPLGILRQVSPHFLSLTMQPREWIVLYTDGLLEAWDSEKRELGIEGICNALPNSPASVSEVVDALDRAELNHRGSAAPHDDLTVLAFGLQ